MELDYNFCLLEKKGHTALHAIKNWLQLSKYWEWNLIIFIVIKSPRLSLLYERWLSGDKVNGAAVSQTSSWIPAENELTFSISFCQQQNLVIYLHPFSFLLHHNPSEWKSDRKNQWEGKKAERERKNGNYACMQFIVITISLPFVFGWNPWIT